MPLFNSIKTTLNGAISVDDDRTYATPGGSQFIESVRDDISHQFTSNTGAEQIARLQNSSISGSVSLDTVNGQAVFTTTAVPGSRVVFFSEHSAIYEPGHGILGEQTIEIKTARRAYSATDWPFLHSFFLVRDNTSPPP